MTPLTWNHACSVGVRAMDDQHSILMETINDLRLALTRGASREQVALLVDRLIEFTRVHFRSEEQLMEQTGFPGLAEHRAAHQVILAQIIHAAHQLQYGESVALQPALGSLRNWLIDHIEALDRQYGPWLNERGVS